MVMPKDETLKEALEFHVSQLQKYFVQADEVKVRCNIIRNF